MIITYKMTAPLSHIGETASTGSYFQTVLTSGGRVPVVTGNSVRGEIRNHIAAHLLDTVGENIEGGAKVSKEAFHILFSGGNVNSSMRDDLEKARQVREHFPALSLMGAALGDMIMDGRLRVGFAYPVCKETESITGISSDVSWHNLIDEMEFTRMDDAKDDQLAGYMKDASEESKGTASQQMRYSVQYMAPGTQLFQKIDVLPGTNDLEWGALWAGLKRWFQNPYLGGMAAKGFGRFEPTVSGELHDTSDLYEAFLREEGMKYFYLLESGGGKRGKASDKPD